MQRFFCLCLILLSFPLLVTAHTSAQSLPEEATDRLIIGLKNPAAAEPQEVQARIRELTSRTGVLLNVERSLANGMHVARLFVPQKGEQLKSTVAALNQDSKIQFAVIDRRMRAQAVPNDPLYSPWNPATDSGQWYLQPPSNATVGAIDAQSAWDLSTGSTNLVIAVIDTGVIFDHPDLGRAGQGGRLLNGYDFVSADAGGGYLRANDNDGWDSDPSDPGDWVNNQDLTEAVFSGCETTPSDWHGTRVAGLIGAIANNNIGMAGVTWSGWLQPVRALGKCGGYESDAIAAINWAAGISVAGAPANPYPANVINVSFGASGACDAAYQSAINAVRAKGIALIAAAGNDSGAVLAPASCPGVIAVTAIAHNGAIASYSNTGPQVALAAPGGDCCQYSDDTTYDVGATVPSGPGYTDQRVDTEGTSFSAPLVSGVVGLMLSVNANLTPDQLSARLKASSRPFVQSFPTTVSCPNGVGAACACTTATCGAGMLDAHAAVMQAQRPIAAITTSGNLSAGSVMTLSAANAAAACGRTLTSFSWSASGAASTALATASAQSTSFTVPAGAAQVSLTVTDDQGASDVATITIQGGARSGTAPVSAGSHACLPAITQPGSASAPVTDSAPAASSDNTAPSSNSASTATPPASPAPPVSAPAVSSKSGGGGGAIDTLTLLFAGLLVLGTRYRKSSVER
jgi:serine protease